MKNNKTSFPLLQSIPTKFKKPLHSNMTMPHIDKPANSEVDAYSYIKEELARLGWIVKNPARIPNGEVYKQNEPLSNTDLKEVLVRAMPEAIVKLNEVDFWVIESKGNDVLLFFI